MPNTEVLVQLAGAPHRDEFRQKLFDDVQNHSGLVHLQKIAAMGNSENPGDPDVPLTGAVYEVSPDMPLTKAAALLGSPACTRTAFYRLSQEPTHLNTIKKVQSEMEQRAVAARIDDYGEDYGGFSHTDPRGKPWVPQLDNGAGAKNTVKLIRSTDDSSRFGIVVTSNADPQMRVAIAAAIGADPSVTVGKFISSSAYRDVSTKSTLQNNRIADRFARQLGISDLLSIRSHHTEMTSDDKYAANVTYAVHDSIAHSNDFARGSRGSVRITNEAIDLTTTQGKSVALVKSPLAGVTLLTSNDPKSTRITPVGSKTGDALAAAPRTIAMTRKLGAAEQEQLSSVVHVADKNPISMQQIASTVAAIDPKAVAFSEASLDMAGLSHLSTEQYQTLGAVMIQ